MTNTSVQSVGRDAEIAQEVARIRQEYPYQGNYREQMAALMGVMFFKFGERVGANRLAALLAENGRSPSTSTAQDEINKFWTKVRENSAIKLNRPDLPPFLLDLFSTMAGAVWENSMSQAGAMFEAHRQEVEAHLTVARKETAKALEQLGLARAGAEDALNQVQVAKEVGQGLARQLAAEVAKRTAAESTVVELSERLAVEQKSREDETERLHLALADLKSGLARATDEQRRLMTIGDEFKQQAARDRALRVRSEKALACALAETARLQEQVTLISGERGKLEGLMAGLEQQVAWLTKQQSSVEKTHSVLKRRTRPGLKSRKN